MGSTLDHGLLAHIGRTSPPQTEVVTRRDIRKYAVATGQRLKKFLDGDEAPPTYHVALFWPVVPLGELSRQELEEIITDAWATKAPKRLVKAHLG